MPQVPVVGSDGHSPEYQPDARWTIWSIDEIYLGGPGLNRFVPKINDYVVEPTTGQLYIVTDLNTVTYIPELTPIQLINQSSNILLSSTNDNYRIYYDKSTSPYILAPDALIHIYSDTASYARIYKGQFIDSNNIISRMYDNSNNFIGFDIPLVNVAFNSFTNYHIKSIPPCWTNANLQSGDVCCIAVFSATGKVVSKIICIVEETTYVAPQFAEQNYVANISLVGPYVDSIQDKLLLPANIDLSTTVFTGRVHYSDNTTVDYPIIPGDPTLVMSLDGLSILPNNAVGHTFLVSLRYRLGPNEAAIATLNVNNAIVTRPYTVEIVNNNFSVNTKIYAFPVWRNNQYELDYFLINLDRTNLYYVPPSAVSIIQGNYDPNLLTGQSQRFKVSLNTSSVPAFPVSGIIISQDLIVALNTQATSPPTPPSSPFPYWLVYLNPPPVTGNYNNNNHLAYGSYVVSSVDYGLLAIRDSSNPNRVRVDNNLSLTQFLEFVYRRTYPLIHPNIDLDQNGNPVLPQPTHIEVRTVTTNGPEVVIKPISQYNTDFVFNGNLILNSNLYIVFRREGALNNNSYLFTLSVAGMLIK